MFLNSVVFHNSAAFQNQRQSDRSRTGRDRGSAVSQPAVRLPPRSASEPRRPNYPNPDVGEAEAAVVEELRGLVVGQDGEDGLKLRGGLAELAAAVEQEAALEVGQRLAFALAAFRRVGVEDLVEFRGLAFPGDAHAVHDAQVELLRVAQRGVRLGGEQQRHVVGLGEAFDAGGEVDGVGDDGAVEPLVAADGAEDEAAGMETDADAHGRLA